MGGETATAPGEGHSTKTGATTAAISSVLAGNPSAEPNVEASATPNGPQNINLGEIG